MGDVVEKKRDDDDKTLLSLSDLKKAIPSKYFESSLLWSLFYVAQDLILICALYVMAYFMCGHPFESFFLPVFWFIQGFLFWAVFVLGHDCGHGSFSRYKSLNYFIGHILHSSILVPFHSWRISHRIHHKNTGNYEKDEIFLPLKEEEYFAMPHIARFFYRELMWGLPIAFPLYLTRNYGWGKKKIQSHFNPHCDLFRPDEAHYIWQSGMWCLAMVCLLTYLTSIWGIRWLVLYYIAPLLVCYCWLLVVTFLHHTRPGTIWYANSNWNYVKGNLQSIDRVYSIFEYFHHDIGTHVVHHLFPAIPHYHLRNASEVIFVFKNSFFFSFFHFVFFVN
jgi:acyl-lipid omega-3 desaturase